MGNWTLNYTCADNGVAKSLDLAIRSWNTTRVTGSLTLPNEKEYQLTIANVTGGKHKAETSLANPKISFEISVVNGLLVGTISAGSECSNRQYNSTKLPGESFVTGQDVTKFHSKITFHLIVVFFK